MRADADSTAHYEAVITDLRSEYKQLVIDAQNAEQLAREKKKKAADTQHLIENLELRIGRCGNNDVAADNQSENLDLVAVFSKAMTDDPLPHQSDLVKGLGLGDACVAVLGEIERSATNREILLALQMNGYAVNSENPINNIGSCLNHRMKSKGDVKRVGKLWSLVPKGDAVSFNGATTSNVTANLDARPVPQPG